MKKITAISLAFVAVFSIVNSQRFLAGQAEASRPVDLSALPPELVVPAQLPAGIDDPILLEAWVRLYAHQEPITLWDGRQITGRDLAQYLADQGLPVVWNVTHVCGGGSCSQQYCPEQVCAYHGPIFISLERRADMPALVGVLAHEIFHRRLPFGPVPDTQFEEYWAMVVLDQIAPAPWLQFGAFDPFNPGQLVLWITANRLELYAALQAYPPGITPVDLTAASAGDPFDAIPADVR